MRILKYVLSLGLIFIANQGINAQNDDKYVDDAYLSRSDIKKREARAKQEALRREQERQIALSRYQAQQAQLEQEYRKKQRDKEIDAYNGYTPYEEVEEYKSDDSYTEKHRHTDVQIYGPYSERLARFHGNGTIIINSPGRIYVDTDYGYYRGRDNTTLNISMGWGASSWYPFYDPFYDPIYMNSPWSNYYYHPHWMHSYWGWSSPYRHRFGYYSPYTDPFFWYGGYYGGYYDGYYSGAYGYHHGYYQGYSDRMYAEHYNNRGAARNHYYNRPIRQSSYGAYSSARSRMESGQEDAYYSGGRSSGYSQSSNQGYRGAARSSYSQGVKHSGSTSGSGMGRSTYERTSQPNRSYDSSNSSNGGYRSAPTGSSSRSSDRSSSSGGGVVRSRR